MCVFARVRDVCVCLNVCVCVCLHVHVCLCVCSQVCVACMHVCVMCVSVSVCARARELQTFVLASCSTFSPSSATLTLSASFSSSFCSEAACSSIAVFRVSTVWFRSVEEGERERGIEVHVYRM